MVFDYFLAIFLLHLNECSSLETSEIKISKSIPCVNDEIKQPSNNLKNVHTLSKEFPELQVSYEIKKNPYKFTTVCEKREFH